MDSIKFCRGLVFINQLFEVILCVIGIDLLVKDIFVIQNDSCDVVVCGEKGMYKERGEEFFK